MSTINKPFRKKDAMQLVTGQPVYMDDVIPQDCLIVKLLRSPHANAIVKTMPVLPASDPLSCHQAEYNRHVLLLQG